MKLGDFVHQLWVFAGLLCRAKGTVPWVSDPTTLIGAKIPSSAPQIHTNMHIKS